MQAFKESKKLPGLFHEIGETPDLKQRAELLHRANGVCQSCDGPAVTWHLQSALPVELGGVRGDRRVQTPGAFEEEATAGPV